jgi:hypothetical protein
VNQDLAQQYFHAGGFRFVQTSSERQRHGKNNRCGGEKNRKPVPAQA